MSDEEMGSLLDSAPPVVEDVDEVPPSLRRRSTFDIEPLTAVTAAASVRTTAMATADSARTTAEPPADADAEGEGGGGGGERLSLDLQLGGEGAEGEGAADAPEAAD